MADLLETAPTRLLFIATLVFNGHTFRLYYQANRTPEPNDDATVEMKAQETPMLDGQQPVAPSYPQYTDQQQYQQQYQPQTAPPPQPTPSPGPVPSQSPAPQYPVYNNNTYGQPQYQQQTQGYPTAGYPPAQGEPYYPPAQ